MKEKKEVEIWREEDEHFIKIRVRGVTSGMRIHFGDGDEGGIEFLYDKSRFDVNIVRRSS